jgi:hypothetical protein
VIHVVVYFIANIFFNVHHVTFAPTDSSFFSPLFPLFKKQILKLKISSSFFPERGRRENRGALPAAGIFFPAL